MAHAN